MEVTSSSNNWVTLKVKPTIDEKWDMAFVYGAPQEEQREAVWEVLANHYFF